MPEKEKQADNANFYPARMGLRKMRKKEQKTGKGQAYLLVPFSLPGMIMGICIG